MRCGEPVANGDLRAVDRAAVAGDLPDQPAVQRLQVARRVDPAQVDHDVVDGVLEALERPAPAARGSWSA